MIASMQAVDAQLGALRMVRRVRAGGNELFASSAELIEFTLKNATPFWWSIYTMEAVMAASKAVPNESKLDGWNLDCPAAFWYFEKPLPIITTDDRQLGVKVLTLGWVAKGPRGLTEPDIYTGPHQDRPRAFLVDAWVETRGELIPTSRFFWPEGLTLAGMVRRSAQDFFMSYGPGMPYEHEPHLTMEQYAGEAESIAKFIMAAAAWLAQKIVVETEERAERHRRKEFHRVTARQLDAVKVVHMRRAEYRHIGSTPNESGREYSCQWTVDGHWRLARVGVGRTERRLTYVHPYVKGPDGKPFRVPRGKVIAVDR